MSTGADQPFVEHSEAASGQGKLLKSRYEKVVQTVPDKSHREPEPECGKKGQGKMRVGGSRNV